MRVLGSGTPPFLCLTALGKLALELLCYTAAFRVGSSEWCFGGTLPQCLGVVGS